MKPYLLSVAVGLLVGVIYALLDVRSPAPPVIALVGLLGILAGEQIPPRVRQLMGHSAPLQTAVSPATLPPHATPPKVASNPQTPGDHRHD